MLTRTIVCCMFFLAAGLEASPEQKNAQVPVRSDFQISGTLLDAISGQPLAHARVAIAPVTQRDDFTTVITAEDGRFIFPNLSPGKYTLTAQARGYLLQSFDQHDQFASSIAVGPRLDSGNLLFRLPPEAAISGVVTDEAGEPIREAQVMLYYTGIAFGFEGTRLRSRTMTDDRGAYHFGHLAPGRYLIAVSAKPWYAQYPSIGSLGGVEALREGQAGRANPQLDVAYPITFYAGVTDATDATPIALGVGDKFSADLSLQPVPALHVSINTGNGGPESGRFFILQRRVLGGPPIQVQTMNRSRGSGVEEIAGIPAGHYSVMSYTPRKGGPGKWAPSREIDIDDNGEVEGDRDGAYIPVTAALHFDSGMPVRQSLLQLRNKKTRERFFARTSSNGEASFKQGVPAGSYEVSIANSPGIYLHSVSATGAKLSGRTIAIRRGVPVKLTIRAAHDLGRIDGRALRDGKPFAGAMILLVPADPVHNQVLFRRDQSDSDGTFTLSQVVPGTYTVLALENGWKMEWMNPEVLRRYLPAGVQVKARANGKYTVKVAVQ